MRKLLLHGLGAIIAIGVISGTIGTIAGCGEDEDETISSESVVVEQANKPDTESNESSGGEGNSDPMDQPENDHAPDPVPREEKGEVEEESEELEESEATPTPTPTPTQTPAVDQSPSGNTLLTKLDALIVSQESAIAPYDRDEFPHWDDEDGDGLNTRLEVLQAQKIGDTGWYSRWDGIWYEGEGDLSAPSFDIDHIVALSEAWDSGASEWSASDRDIFADDLLNLVAVSASSNRSKGGRDAGEWLPSDPLGKCFLSIRVIEVKSKWELSIDQAEYNALTNLITSCGSEIPPVPSPPPSSPTPTPTPPIPTPQSSYGSQYYVTANGVDIDQYDSNGNGDINCTELPSSAKPVTVISTGPGGDPYGLDGDSDGTGCE